MENNSKTKAEAPKVVNVIPKSSEQIFKPTKSPPNNVQLPVSVTEIKVDIKPYSSRHHGNVAKDEKPGLVRAITTQIEVLQAPAVVATTDNKAEITTSKPLDIRLVSDKPTGVYPTQSTQANPEQEEYDSNTLKPPKEWECHLCTLLNPDSSNICAVCATVRIKTKTTLKRSKKKPAPQPQKDQTYLQLVNLDSADLVPNADIFECLVCFLEVARGDGVTLRECLHQFCRDCLARHVEFSDDAEVKCPYR